MRCRTRRTFVYGLIRRAPSARINDPFDCQLDLRSAIFRSITSTDTNIKPFLAKLLVNDEFFEKWHKQLDNVGIYSFSLNRDDIIKEPLMWSHYADSHKGVCFKYSIPGSFFDKLKHQTDGLRLITVQEVKYDNTWFSEFINSSPSDFNVFITDLVQMYLSRKSPSWAYEKEGRIIVSRECNLPLPSSCIRKIIFGLNTPIDDRMLIYKLVKQFSDCDSFFQMTRGDDDYDLTHEKFDA